MPDDSYPNKFEIYRLVERLEGAVDKDDREVANDCRERLIVAMPADVPAEHRYKRLHDALVDLFFVSGRWVRHIDRSKEKVQEKIARAIALF